jgi:hypothetical protein
MVPEVVTWSTKSDLEKVEPNVSALYDTPPLWRKSTLVFATSWNTLGACFSITSLLSASNEIAAEFGMTSNVINLSTGGLLVAMGHFIAFLGPIPAVIHPLPDETLWL